MRAEEEWQRAGAYFVRVQGMNRQYHISLREEFDEHDTEGTKYIILLDDGYPIATCRFYECSTDSVVLGRVVVLPEYRSRGYGEKLLSIALINNKTETMSLTVDVDNIPAINLYEKLGYKQNDDSVIKSGSFDCVRMSKIIKGMKEHGTV